MPADYVYLDEDGLLYLKSLLDAHFQAQVTGKGLSENDFTDSLKSKLDNIEASADVNVIEDVKMNNVSLTVSSKAVNIPVMGAAGSSAAGSSGVVPAPNSGKNTAFLRGDATWVDILSSPTFTGVPAAPTASTGTNTTQIATTAFVKAAIDAALAGISGVSFSFVSELPSSGSAGIFYFVPQSGGGTTGDVYDEYIWDATNSTFEKIGSTAVDMTGYVQTSQMGAISNSTIDSIFSDW